MINELMDKGGFTDRGYRGHDVTKLMNSIVHGDPLSAFYNLTEIGEGEVGFAVGKVIRNPKLCDDVCFHGITWMAVLLGMMSGIFPENNET